jgi:site-specific DNA-methyltransferase (adenine-specific)
MKELEDNSIDLVLTDPPYGIDLTPGRVTSKFHGTKIENDSELSWVPEFYSQIYRLTKNVAYVFCGWSTVDIFMKEAREVGFKHKNTIVWDKGQFGMGWNYRPQYELVLLLVKDNFTTKSHSIANIIKIQKIHHTKLTHVAEKPVDLLKIFIEQSTEEGGVVLDPYAGSCSTLLAAKLLKRNYIGIELDEEYVNSALEKLK